MYAHNRCLLAIKFRLGTIHSCAPDGHRDVQGVTPCNFNTVSARVGISQTHSKTSLKRRKGARIILSVIQIQIHKDYVKFTQAAALLFVPFLKWFKSYIIPRFNYYLHFVQELCLIKDRKNISVSLFLYDLYEECILRWLYLEKPHLNDLYKIFQ